MLFKKGRSNDLFYNASGAADPTAAQALGTMIKEEKEMKLAKYNPAPGEVWLNGNNERLAVLAVTGRIMSCVKLRSVETTYSTMTIRGYHVNTGIINSIYVDNAVNFDFALTEEEFTEIKENVADSLGISCVLGGCSESEKDKEIAELKEQVRELSGLVSPEVVREDDLLAEITTLKAQNSLLDKLYNDLLGKLVK